MLKAMTKTVIETALDEELSSTLDMTPRSGGYGSGNSRNGTRSKTVLTDACGSIEIDVHGIGQAHSSRRSSKNASVG
ncbi:transposase, Mutator family protein [Mycobacterium ulcerans str. Harvey]|uniref:Transposase, Mutator family protein n=1 Tax=Mycobacterium ulcerans str. Harvey TaxID=1299332 RepID=A0ABP3ATI4_MYCUL|nr:transposase, Mutator family protein [Mycobacterium ulcerans str. Harvey]